MNYTRRKVKIMIALITICLLVGVATNIKAHIDLKILEK